MICEDALNLIKEFEGCRLKAYKCSAGKWTIGYGHTAGVKMGMVITKEQAEAFLESDLQEAEKDVDTLVTVHLTENQRGTLVSFVFNLGRESFRRSSLLAGVNAGEFLIAAQEFPKWCYAGGKKNKGLIRRRAAEKALFLKE